jgi:hypothetical protein
VVSYDEPLAVVNDYIVGRGFTDLISVQGVGDMMSDLEVTRQAEMMAINGDGIMYHRQVIGDLTEWRSHLDALAANPAAVPSGFESDRQKDQRRQDLQLPS